MRQPTLLRIYRWSIAAISLTVARAAPRFEVNGPVVTLTLKEPSSASDEASGRPWITDVSSVRPKATWSVRTNPSPFPRLLPTLKQFRADIGFEYHRLRQAPSWFEATARFSTQEGDLVIQPSYDVPSRRQTLLVQASRGASYILAKFGGSTPSRRLVSALKGSFLLNLPYASISAVRLTPAWDFVKRDLACTVEAVTGGPSRTKAVLSLDYYNPTLTVVHALDERNTIAPEINLYNAKIIYQWDLLLGESGSSLRTKVDPVTAIHVTWTDVSASGGTWVTDVRLRKYSRVYMRRVVVNTLLLLLLFWLCILTTKMQLLRVQR